MRFFMEKGAKRRLREPTDSAHMSKTKLVFWFASLSWFALGATVLGFIFYFVSFKILIPGPGFGEINLLILILSDVVPGVLVFLTPKFFAKLLSIELESNGNMSVSLVGSIEVFLLFLYGGGALYFFFYPYDLWLQGWIFGHDVSIAFIGFGASFAGIAGWLLWKNFDVNIKF